MPYGKWTTYYRGDHRIDTVEIMTIICGVYTKSNYLLYKLICGLRYYISLHKTMTVRIYTYVSK